MPTLSLVERLNNLHSQMDSLVMELSDLRNETEGIIRSIAASQPEDDDWEDEGDDDDDDDEDELPPHVIRAVVPCKPGTKGKALTVYLRENAAKVRGYGKWWTSKIRAAQRFNGAEDARNQLDELSDNDPDTLSLVRSVKVVELRGG